MCGTSTIDDIGRLKVKHSGGLMINGNWMFIIILRRLRGNYLIIAFSKGLASSLTVKNGHFSSMWYSRTVESVLITKQHCVNSSSGREDAPSMFPFSQHVLLTTTPTERAQLYSHHLTSWWRLILFYLNLLFYCELRNTSILFGPALKSLPWPLWAHPNATSDLIWKYLKVTLEMVSETHLGLQVLSHPPSTKTGIGRWT